MLQRKSLVGAEEEQTERLNAAEKHTLAVPSERPDGGEGGG